MRKEQDVGIVAGQDAGVGVAAVDEYRLAQTVGVASGEIAQGLEGESMASSCRFCLLLFFSFSSFLRATAFGALFLLLLLPFLPPARLPATTAPFTL